MQMREKYSWAQHLDFMLIDLAALLFSYYLAFFLKFNTLHLSVEWRKYILIISLINILVDLILNPFEGIFRRRYYHEIGRFLFNAGVNALLASLIFYILKIGEDYSREVFIYTYVFFYAISLVLNYLWKKLLISGKLSRIRVNRISLFLICDRENAESVIHSVYSTALPLFEIKGVFLAETPGEQPGSEDKLVYKDISAFENIPVINADPVRYILDNNINEVMVAVPPQTLEPGIYKDLIANGVSINYVIEPMLGLQTEEQTISNIGVNKALSVGTFSFSPSQSFYLIIKRIFDILCGLIGMIVLIPITLFVKLAYLASGDTARIFYRQNRIGMNGKKIRIWKFRTMVPDAEEILKKMLQDDNYRKEWEENQKFENDPRITKAGAILRKTSIDELPQLINVLIGDMSLVGPRPLVEGELLLHNGLKLYEKVKPGITGWWGCNGRSSINYNERLELEYYYVKNCSFYLDILCIIRTVYAVLKKEGAQ